MWQAIRANRRRSILLASVMGLILLAVGAALGAYLGGGNPTAVLLGIGAALLVWGVQLAAAFAGGDKLVLAVSGARKIHKYEAPALWNVVEEMTIASGLGKMPNVYVIDDPSPNAFATGRNPEKSAVAVTTGLLRRLDRDELQGVIGHEIGHVKNQDVKFMTLAAVMLGTIVILSDILLRTFIYSGGRRGGRRSGEGGGGGWIMLAVLLVALLGPLFAQLLYFACSRKREYLADASSALFTRYPEGLASALEKISKSAVPRKNVNRALAPLYIVNPLQGRAAVGLTSTHPPTEERIKILRSMAGAGYGDYEKAYKTVHSGRVLLGSLLASQVPHLGKRKPSAAGEEAEKDKAQRAREALETLDRTAGLLVLACPCGVRIKVPPDFKEDHIECPRCGRVHEIPKAVLAGAVAGAMMGAAVKGGAAKKEAAPSEAEPLVFKRRGKGWQGFKCTCGATVNVSPAFRGDTVKCPKCGRKIKIVD